MPRLLLTVTTNGTEETHRENAERLRSVIRQFE
jgi:hypothetical protein